MKVSLRTFSVSQTLTVLSAEDVASLDRLGLKRTSVIHWVCSSSVDFTVKDSVHHNTACTKNHWANEFDIVILETQNYLALLRRNIIKTFKEQLINNCNKPSNLFIMSTSGKKFSIWWEVTTFNFTCTCRNKLKFRKCEA